MKPLSQSSVPFHARWLFRLRHINFALMCIALAISLPFTLIIGLLFMPNYLLEYIEGVTNEIEKRTDLIKAERAALIRKYSREA